MKLSVLSAATVRWAAEAGLGPLLYYATKNDPVAHQSPLWLLVHSANLTARVIAGNQLDALCEILDACVGNVGPLTMLKGISLCTQHYPEPQLRPMRDLDFLVDEARLPTIESLLMKLGYQQRSQKPAAVFVTHHHTMPWFHAGHGVWVEVHRGLVPTRRPVAADQVFGLAHIKSQSRPSELCGRAVTRLSPELQVIYIATHWATELRVVSGMVAMLDIIYLLRDPIHAIDWDAILRWLRGSVAAIYLYLLLTYLNRYQLIAIEPQILHALHKHQRPLDARTLNILHGFLDRCMVEGLPLRWPMPVRTLSILWKTLLLPGSPWRNLLLIPRNLLLPWSLRARLLP